MNSHLLSTLKSTLEQCFDQEKKLYIRILIAVVILYLLSLGLNSFIPKFSQHVIDFTGNSKDGLVSLVKKFIQLFIALLLGRFIFLGAEIETTNKTIGTDFKKIVAEIGQHFKLYLLFFKQMWKPFVVLSLWLVVLPLGIIANSDFSYGSNFFRGFPENSFFSWLSESSILLPIGIFVSFVLSMQYVFSILLFKTNKEPNEMLIKSRELFGRNFRFYSLIFLGLLHCTIYAKNVMFRLVGDFCQQNIHIEYVQPEIIISAQKLVLNATPFLTHLIQVLFLVAIISVFQKYQKEKQLKLYRLDWILIVALIICVQIPLFQTSLETIRVLM